MLKGIIERDDVAKDALLESKKKIQKMALDRYMGASENETSNRASKDFSKDKMIARSSAIDESDTIAMERILGENDLMPISYLLTGFKVSNSVCRIRIGDKVGNVAGYGTGFLVSENIIMTNNHVIPDIQTAKNSICEFNYQNDEKFMPCPTYAFALEPNIFFITSEELDFTIVAVSNKKNNGKYVSDFGKIQLEGGEEKVLEGEYVSIIQHPKGGPKAVTLRENQVKYIFDDYIHYITDTQPGSSGSPVFNDQWVLVGLHHSGVPSPDKKNVWIANEGIRISSIVKYIKKKYDKMIAKDKKIVGKILPDLKVIDDKKDDDKVYSRDYGYDISFLAKNRKVEFPKLSKEMLEDTTRMKDGNYILDYMHFSIVMCKSRGLAYFTAVNIDGNQKVHIKRGGDKWCFDNRISEKYQYGNEVYKSNDLDRGHLVKRTDPNWGEGAHQANSDTFHYTNSAPQHKNLNQKIWLGLEDYILHNANNHKLKVSVFTGPVFSDKDKVYRKKYKIPEEFWKVVVMVKNDSSYSATAYLQTQENMLGDLEFVYGQYETYQVPISKIEEKTGLDFGKLSKYDPMANVEASGLIIKDESTIRL